MSAISENTVESHFIRVEDLLNRAMLSAFAAAAISLTIGLPSATAAASPDELAAESIPATRTVVTAPFDPVCPLCFLRELLESGSSHP
ncbi:hypothetical protein ACQPZ2_00055 [Nocardia pseudovaccinii]|uniref:hypothetical protein n=1 Tax=Nocardia pseudovaccinii TaxID=189540 RepID=UPI003D8A8965